MSTRNVKVLLYLEIGQPGRALGQVFKFNFLTFLTVCADSEQLNLSNCWIGQRRRLLMVSTQQ